MASMTKALQERLSRGLPYEELLPEEQPAYVHSYVYLFGVATVASFALLIATGLILAAFGPQWWHFSKVGLFCNSLHFWSVQAFFFFLVVHLWTAFFQGAWRDGRNLTWASGVIAFLVSIVTAFTGYVSQQNFDSQWISFEGKDGMNPAGIGAFFNILNFGQMYGFHVFILPWLVALIVGVHLTLVRMRGVVRPYDREVNPASKEDPA